MNINTNITNRLKTQSNVFGKRNLINIITDGDLVGKQLQKNGFFGLIQSQFDRTGLFFAYFCLMFNTVLAITFWHRIDDWDKWLFVKLNGQWTNPFFDIVLPFIRNSVFWAPIYIFVAAFIGLNFGRKGLWWSLLFVCTIATTDLIGARVLKEAIHRPRPCQDVEFMNYVRLLLKQCSGSYSFVSNHAANHFGMATFSFLTFRGLFRKWMYLAYAWAVFIAYAQVYVGVHYPLDVVGGAVLGIIIGSVTAWIFDNKWGRISLE